MAYYKETPYTVYNSPSSRAQLNQNVIRGPVSEYPRNLYKGSALRPTGVQPDIWTNAMAGGVFVPKDPSVDYFVEQVKGNTHPAHFSRYGYASAGESGYVYGIHPGRYITRASCIPFTSAQPEGMAPAKYYDAEHLDPNNCTSHAYINSKIVRDSI